MPFCTQCGHDNPIDANFCSQCGTRLSGGSAATESPGEVTSTLNLKREDVDRAVGDDGGEVSTSELSPADQAAVEALPTGSALLVVLRGPNAGSRFLLDTDVVTAGRHPESDIFLDDVTVSRRHAELRRTADGFVVRDVGSLNGTYVNRDRIDEVPLSNGDEVQIGKYRLVYYAGASGIGGGVR